MRIAMLEKWVKLRLSRALHMQPNDSTLPRNVDRPETNVLLSDIEKQMSDMPLITRRHAGPDVLMPLRMTKLRLDPGYYATVDPAFYQSMKKTCESCRYWRACARDLALVEANNGLAGYCNNLAAFDRLLVER